MPEFCEHAAKPLLRRAGFRVPGGIVAKTPAEAAAAAEEIGPCMIKAQVPVGGRGKAGGIRPAAGPDEAAAAARELLGAEIAGSTAKSVLIEELVEFEREYYAAVLTDQSLRCPVALFSTSGGVDVEEAAAADPVAVCRIPIDILRGLDAASAAKELEHLSLGTDLRGIAEALERLYACYRRYDAELFEINPLAAIRGGGLVALDCKFAMDGAAVGRQPETAAAAAPEQLTVAEQKAADAGLNFVELDGDVGVLANGAGLTMAMVDVVAHLGGAPANFLEIGGDAYSKAETAWQLLMELPGLRSAVVNFCGAFARTDVMAAGIAAAWKTRPPAVPVFFCVRGTGETEAAELLQKELDITPHESMEGAIEAAVRAAGRGRT